MSPEDFQDFIKLIELDNQANKLRVERENIARKMERIEGDLSSISQTIEGLDDTLKQYKKRIHAVELEMKTIEAQENAKRETMESAQSVKEYNASQAELERLEERRAKIEERYITLWQEYQDKEQRLEKEHKRLDEEKQALLQSGEEFQVRSEEIDTEYETVKAASRKAEGRVEEEILDEYKRLRERTPDPVVPIDRKSCSSCFFLVNQADLQNIRHYALVTCKNCFRKLYSPELVLNDEQH